MSRSSLATQSLTELRHPYIVLEGADGVGKTSLCQALKRRLKQAVIYTLPQGLPNSMTDVLYREVILTYPDEPLETQALLYLAGHFNHQLIIETLQAQGPVLADRSLLSTCVYQYLLPEKLHDIMAALNWPLHSPDALILLSARQTNLYKRLEIRDQDDNVMDLFTINALQVRYQSLARRTFPNTPLIEFDTTDHPVEGSTDILISHLLARHIITHDALTTTK